MAAYGHQVGREATAEALAWAWEHWDRMVSFHNPAGYLYRVGQSRARRLRRQATFRRSRDFSGAQQSVGGPGWVEPGLDDALGALTRQQRVAVVLCYGFQWTHREVAQLLDIAPSTVQNHVERGLVKLRARLGEDQHERSG